MHEDCYKISEVAHVVHFLNKLHFLSLCYGMPKTPLTTVKSLYQMFCLLTNICNYNNNTAKKTKTQQKYQRK